MTRTGIRPMSEADLEQVQAIAAELKDAPHWAREAYLTAMDAGAMPRRVALVAAGGEPGEVIGFAVASVVTPQADLESIAVAEPEQGRGLGRDLLRALAEELRTLGVGEVLLEVRASNTGALGFYRKTGWSETGRRRTYYADPEEDAVLMSWQLGR